MTGGEGWRQRGELWGNKEETFQSVVYMLQTLLPSSAITFQVSSHSPFKSFFPSLTPVLYHLPERVLTMLLLALVSLVSLQQYQSTDAVSRTELSKWTSKVTSLIMEDNTQQDLNGWKWDQRAKSTRHLFTFTLEIVPLSVFLGRKLFWC